jgi:hypothetical protein
MADQAPGIEQKLEAVEDFAAEQGGVFSLGFRPDPLVAMRSWSAMLTWGREARDSPMAGAQALGSGSSAEEAIDQVIGEARIEVGG